LIESQSRRLSGRMALGISDWMCCGQFYYSYAMLHITCKRNYGFTDLWGIKVILFIFHFCREEIVQLYWYTGSVYFLRGSDDTSLICN
jgi:hypothetical protein